jgi:hypothetical protein
MEAMGVQWDGDAAYIGFKKVRGRLDALETEAQGAHGIHEGPHIPSAVVQQPNLGHFFPQKFEKIPTSLIGQSKSKPMGI